MLQASQTYAAANVEALDVMTGKRRSFTVYHDEGRVVEIRYSDGYGVPKRSEQFTETEDAFHIDRQLSLVKESDVQGYAWLCYA